MAVLSLLALRAASGCAGPEADCPVGASLCLRNEVMLCEGAPAAWINHGSCLDRFCTIPVGGQAMCVESRDPDPLCNPEGLSTPCEGDAIASCTSGYRTETVACGTGHPGPEATHCVERAPFTGACVSPTAVTDPVCDGGSGPRCADTTLVECIAGLAVARTACVSCEVTDMGGDIGFVGTCRGSLGGACDTDLACAAGLTCHADTQGTTRCTMACAPDSLPPPDAVASQECLDVFQAGGPPPSAYLEVERAGTVLACLAGFCEWTQ